jgi:hypothetical protein
MANLGSIETQNSFNEYGTSDHFSEPISHHIENGIPADAIWDSDALKF